MDREGAEREGGRKGGEGVREGEQVPGDSGPRKPLESDQSAEPSAGLGLNGRRGNRLLSPVSMQDINEDTF